jgi:arylsulfatase A-like enzyme
MLTALFVSPMHSENGIVRQQPEPQSKPNLLILLADDLGYSDLGCQGSTDIPTPNIDSIAVSGMRCTSGYVTGCVCSPTRAALLTSRYQQRYGLDSVSDLTVVEGLRSEELTLAERLKPVGYVSAIFGKWHLGNGPDKLPEAQGFEEFCYGEPLNHQGSPLSIRRSSGDPVLIERSVENINTIIGREVPAFIERHKENPWFALVAFKAPHAPQQPPAGFVERFEHITDNNRRRYCASIAAQDETVGLILDALRKSGQEERTLVIYLSDNGGAGQVKGVGGRLHPGESNGGIKGKVSGSAKNDPLRGAKGSLWEGGIRVPMLIQWKGVLPAGKVYDRPISQMDFGATILAIIAADGERSDLDGVNILPYLTGIEVGDPHSSLFWTYLGGQIAVRAGDWKLVRAKDGGETNELYNLENDLGEERNLAADNPAKVLELEERLLAWSREVGIIRETGEPVENEDEE